MSAKTAFGNKLRLFMKHANVKNITLAKEVNVDPALVSLWLSGQRHVTRDNPVLPRIAGFIIQQCSSEVGMRWLGDMLGIDPVNLRLDYNLLLRNVSDWLLLGDHPAKPPEDSAETDFTRLFAGGKVHTPKVGSSGFGEAMNLLADRLLVSSEVDCIRVYISSEYCSTLFEESMSRFWDRLHAMCPQRPLQVYFEQWRDESRVGEFVAQLLPHMLDGRLELHYIRSAEQYFCHNMTLFVPDNCAVLVLEPTAGFGNSVSLFVDDPSFLTPMGDVFARLERIARPMLDLFLSPGDKRIAGLLNSFFGGEGDLSILSDGFSPYYMTAGHYRAFLEARRVGPEQLKYRTSQFAIQRDAFWDALALRRHRELISLDMLDRLATGRKTALCGLPYLNRSLFTLEPEVALAILQGIFSAVESCPDYEMRITQTSPMPAHACLVQEDRRALVQSWSGKGSRSLYTDNWLLIRQIRETFEDAWDSPAVAVRGRDNILEALSYRIDKLSSRTPDEALV